jgi:hypothetical protein
MERELLSRAVAFFARQNVALLIRVGSAGQDAGWVGPVGPGDADGVEEAGESVVVEAEEARCDPRRFLTYCCAAWPSSIRCFTSF